MFYMKYNKRPNGSVCLTQLDFNVTTSNPGVLTTHIELDILKLKSDIDAKVIFTDYDNIMVIYACYEVKYFYNMIMGTSVVNRLASIYVRNRTFDSYTLYAQAITALTNLQVDTCSLKKAKNNATFCRN
jgi:hypothetical protein